MSIFYQERNGYHHPTAFLYTAVAAVVVGIIAGIIMFILWLNYGFLPSRRLARAEIEKRIQVEQARAERDSAVFEAEAEVNRARGVAEANEIIADSLSDEYLRYHYINTIARNSQDTIYIPTEAGLPILEARPRG